MNLTNIGTIRDLMERHGMKFSKSLGQNFLVNPSVCPRMVEESEITSEMGVLEIGPGVGVLTSELAKQAKKVVSIELDTKLLPILEETLAEYSNVKIIHGDVMEVDLAEILATEFPDMDVAVCANLPYYITSPIIMRFLEEHLPVKSITALVQKEAAERICAPIPSRSVGAVTVSIAYYAQTGILFPVSKGSFMPAPNVESAVIRLDLRPQPPVELLAEDAFFRVVRASFSQRRKTIHNSLSSGLALPKEDISHILEQADVSPRLRAEQLTLEQFASIANAVTTQKGLA